GYSVKAFQAVDFTPIAKATLRSLSHSILEQPKLRMLLTPISSRGHVRFYVDAIGDLTPADWARSWISYVLGTVIGRFEIGNANGLGCGDFPEPIVAESANSSI